MGAHTDYMPKTYEPIVPIVKPTPIVYPPLPMPPSMASPPTIQAPSSPAPAPSNTSGNGEIWCSGPSAPGWNRNLPDGGCKATTTAVTGNPVLRLDQLPYTGDSPSDVLLSAGFYGAIIAAALLGIYFIRTKYL